MYLTIPTHMCVKKFDFGKKLMGNKPSLKLCLLTHHNSMQMLDMKTPLMLFITLILASYESTTFKSDKATESKVV